MDFGIVLTLIGGIASVGGYVLNQQNQKIDSLEKIVKDLKSECDIDMRDLKDQIIVEAKYNLNESMALLRSEIEGNRYSIKTIHDRLRERSENARDKWSNLVAVINSIIEFLKLQGYVSANLPINRLDKTLSDIPNTNTFGD